MKILVIGRDPALFEENSESFRRVKEYAGLFDELRVVSMMPRGFEPKREGNLSIWPTNSFSPAFRWLDAVRLGRKIASFAGGVDIIDAQDPGESALAAFFVSKFSGVPLRIQIHTDILSPYFRAASWKELARYYLALFLIPRASCLRVVSERIKSSLVGSGLFPDAAKITVLPIFTDTSKFENAVREPKSDEFFRGYSFKMIAAGRFVDKEKNFSMLIEAMRDFVKSHPRSLLVIVGDGPDKEKYESKIDYYKLKKNVIIEKWRADLASFYKSFDVFLSSSNYEGWGRAVIEAMASGAAVVMTDTGLAGEVVKNGINGVVIPVGDSASLVKALEDLCENPEKRLRMARAGQETARNMAPKTKTEYLAAYKKALESCGF